jgi:very-short-patch-repair endonuclease
MRTLIPSKCAELLEQQCGVLGRWQVVQHGCDVAVIDRLLRSDRWQVLYRGVYASFTGQPSRESALWAAVRRCGPGAALSYYTAAEIDNLADRHEPVLHVTVPVNRQIIIAADERHRDIPRIVVHRSQRADVARHPTKLPARTRVEETVLDLTQVSANLDDAVGWLSRACGRRLTKADLLKNAIDLRRKVRWRAELSYALDDIADGVHSVLEFRYVRDVERAHRLPTAERQAQLMTGKRSQYLDNLYGEFGLVVELDGRAAHLVEARWQDIHRDNGLTRTGLATLRYSWSDVTERPCQTAREIAEVLRARGWPGQPTRCRRCRR